MASGIINGNSLLVTALGTFDYLKNFLVIFIYAAFFKDFNEFRKLFRFLLFIALLLGTVALIQFIWAMGSVYISGKDITDQSVYIFSNISVDDIDTLNNTVWRYGIFRTQSLTYHAYILGLFNLLILTIYFYTEKRVKIKTVIPLLSGVLLSVTRMALGGLIFVTLMQIGKRSKLFILLLLIISIFALTRINTNNNFNMPAILNLSLPKNEESVNINDIRMYTRYKAVAIWKEHPFIGVGPGMFGGIVSFKYNSHIYEEYNFIQMGWLKQIRSIEQFWFQILAEMGVIGSLLFINLIIILLITLYKLREQDMSQDMKNLLLALIVFIPCILIYTIGSGINIAPVLFTYCAFVGIGLGSCQNDIER
ncbi:MAG: O-antigen ligase family protein [Nitrospirae bacterium]|nr:O-antigen ligase family protein [Nitrospirota bacterium]